MITFKYVLITRKNFGYFFKLLHLHIIRLKMPKKWNASIKLRKKEIFEGGSGILEFKHVVQWD